MNRGRRAGAVLVVGIVLAVVAQMGLAASGVAAAAAASPDCRAVDVPVELTDGGVETAHLIGQVCYPTTHVASLDGAVQVLVSGTAYGSSYWDFSYRPDTYSYVRAAAQAGFTTFDFDRIGLGRSTRPLDTAVSIQSNAATIHQAITKLRAGTVDGVRYGKVTIVGHSLGSLISWYEAGTYHDVDAVVTSGILHSFNTLGVAQFVATLYPAAVDPRFLGRVLDPGYLTTLPGTRAASFYYTPNADTAVIATDEAQKETASVSEAVGVFAQELPGVLRPVSQTVCALTPTLCDGPASSLVYGVTRNITVPVLTVVGQYDALLCGGSSGANRCSDVAAVRQAESDYYTGQTQRCLTVAELPDSGHDVNLQRNGQDWFALANEWSRFTVEQGSGGGGGCWSAGPGGGGGVLFP